MIEEKKLSALMNENENCQVFGKCNPSILQVALLLRVVSILRQYTYLILDKYYKDTEPYYAGFKWGAFYMDYCIFVKDGDAKQKVTHYLNEKIFLAAFNAAIIECNGYCRSYMYKLCSNVNGVKFDELVSLDLVNKMKEIGEKVPMPSPSRFIARNSKK